MRDILLGSAAVVLLLLIAAGLIFPPLVTALPAGGYCVGHVNIIRFCAGVTP